MLRQLDTDHDDFSNDEIKKLLHTAEQRLKQGTSVTESSQRSTNLQASSHKHETHIVNIEGSD